MSETFSSHGAEDNQVCIDNLQSTMYRVQCPRHTNRFSKCIIPFLFDLSMQIFVFHQHSVRIGVSMHKNVPQAALRRCLPVLSVDCVRDNIRFTNRAISPNHIRIGRIAVFQRDPIAFMLDQSGHDPSWNRCAARRLQQPLQTSGVYVSAECILRRIYTMLFRTKLLVSWLRRQPESIIQLLYLWGFVHFLQILRLILGHATLGFFGAGRVHDVHDVLLSGQLLWRNAHGIAAFGQMDAHWVAFLCAAGYCVVKIGGVAAGGICKAFGWTVQGMWHCDNGHTGQWHSPPILREYLLVPTVSNILIDRVLFLPDVFPESGQHLSDSVDRAIDHSAAASHHFIYGRRMA